MSNRIHISLPDKTVERFNKIPEGSRSAVIRNLLEAYFRYYDKRSGAFETVLQGNIIVRRKNGNTG